MLFPVFLAILIFLFGSKVIYAAENTEKEADRVQEALFEEFDLLSTNSCSSTTTSVV